MSEAPATDSSAASPPPRRSKKMLIIGLALFAAIAGGASWWFLRGTTADAKAEEPALEERGLLTFEPFLVNLADSGGNRFLKINLQLVVPSAELAEHIQKTPVILMHLRSTILELLTQQSAAALVTPEGKTALRDAIKARTAEVMAKEKVIDVLFSEFVVQF